MSSKRIQRIAECRGAADFAYDLCIIIVPTIKQAFSAYHAIADRRLAIHPKSLTEAAASHGAARPALYKELSHSQARESSQAGTATVSFRGIGR
jgi:hypothetical protein